MLRKIKLVLITSSLAISACSGVPYVPKGSTSYKGGYSDEKTGARTYTVKFEGNGYNKQEQVNGFVRKRASELCSPLKAETEIRPFLQQARNYAALNGQLYITDHKFPSAEASVVCVE